MPRNGPTTKSRPVRCQECCPNARPNPPRRSISAITACPSTAQTPTGTWALVQKAAPFASKHLPGQKHFCTCTHQEYTNLAHAEFKRKQRRQAKEESTRKRKRERDERGANAALLVGAEGEMDVCSGGGKRQRKMTARARGEE